MILNSRLLEDVPAGATPNRSALPAAEPVRLKHVPGADERMFGTVNGDVNLAAAQGVHGTVPAVVALAKASP